MSVTILAVMDKGSDILGHCLSQPKTTVTVGDSVFEQRRLQRGCVSWWRLNSASQPKADLAADEAVIALMIGFSFGSGVYGAVLK